MWSVMNSGPVEQLSPIANRSACISDAASASTVWPASIVPVSSIVAETITGRRNPSSAKTRSMPISAALTVRVSFCVSSASRSAPPSTRPSSPAVVDVHHLREGDAAGDGQRFRRRPEVAGDESRATGRAVGVGDCARKAGGSLVDLAHLVGQVEFGEDDRAAAKRVGGDDVGASLEIAAMRIGDDVGARHVELLRAAIVREPAVVLGRQIAAVQIRAVRTPDNEDAIRGSFVQQLDAIFTVAHGLLWYRMGQGAHGSPADHRANPETASVRPARRACRNGRAGRSSWIAPLLLRDCGVRSRRRSAL